MGKYLGVIYNYRTKEVVLAEKTLMKLQGAASELETSNFTLGDMQKLFGRLFAASMVLHIPLDVFYHCIKCYRRRCSQMSHHNWSKNRNANVWKCIIPQLKTWIAAILRNIPTHPKNPSISDEYTLFTDASLHGWGAMLANKRTGEIWTAAGTHQKQAHINCLEMLAVLHAFDYFNLHLLTNLMIYIDNTSVIGCMKKGRSNSYLLNQILSLVLQRIPTFMNVSVVTSLNSSDWLSRLEEKTQLTSSPSWGGEDYFDKFPYCFTPPTCHYGFV